MEDEKEARFRKLIQEAGVEHPSVDFTNTVMKLVQAEARQAQQNEASLQALLQSADLIGKPSPDFSLRVMGQIEALESRKVEPIISNKAWYFIAASLLLVMTVCGYFVVTLEAPQASPGSMDRLLVSLSDTLENLPVMYPLTLMALSTLLLIDYFLHPYFEKRMLSA